jgi:hypothetical protein
MARANQVHCPFCQQPLAVDHPPRDFEVEQSEGASRRCVPPPGDGLRNRTQPSAPESALDWFIDRHPYLTALAIGVVVFLGSFVVQAWLVPFADALPNAAMFASLMAMATMIILRPVDAD